MKIDKEIEEICKKLKPIIGDDADTLVIITTAQFIHAMTYDRFSS